MNQAALFAFLVVSVFLALVTQQYLPTLHFLHGARVFLLPIVFFFGALALPPYLMLGLAFLAGFMWDALVAVQVLPSDMIGADGRPGMSVEIALGWSIILYGALGAIMSGFRPLYQRGHGWEVHCLMCGPLVALLVLAEYLMITFRRGEFLFPQVIWWRIGGAGIIAMVLAPIVYFFMQTIVTSLGWVSPRTVVTRTVAR